MQILVSFLAVAAASFAATGQSPPSATAQPGAANITTSQDGASPEAVVRAIYEVISGEAGRARDWERFRALFQPDARLVSTRRDPVTGMTTTTSRTIDEYIARNGPKFIEHGFFEREIVGRVERVGIIAHVFSSYESRAMPTDRVPMARGINSFDLEFDGKRWRIVGLHWASETPDNLLPKTYGARHRRE